MPKAIVASPRAGIIQSSLRDECDQAARYGGEELLVLLRDTDEQEAAVVAEQIRSRVEAASLPNPQSATGSYVTVSIGISVTLQEDPLITADTFHRQADEALYRAKQGGVIGFRFTAASIRLEHSSGSASSPARVVGAVSTA
ncbi:diguanylate cyclase (GGDEF)-like protein [Pseudorhizobium tarimense]|uniref:diguanylate cyclase n=1 Tax=Pseudorhizobium tarimense TaxID=1079109 RepID=A0ABV2HBE5_9HYPH